MDLQKLELLECRGTPGPWHYDGGGEYIFSSEKDGNCPVAELRGFGSGFPMDDNAALIVAARNTLPRLIKAINSLYAKIEHGDAEHRRWLKDELEKHFKEALEGP